jgi:hypothetical protein
MLTILSDAGEISRFIYNTPAEICPARQLKAIIEELRGIPVQLVQGGPDGGPMCDGSRFACEFGFQIRALRDYVAAVGV